MDTSGEMLQKYANEIGGHRKWLRSFNEGYASKWEKLLKADPEAAICEAATRELLLQHAIEVKPNEDPSSGGPDFICTRDGKCFYVEVTCITTEKVTQKAHLTDNPSTDGYYRLLTKEILGEICNKTRQCSNLNAPCIIAISTLHRRAGARCFDKHGVENLLTGTRDLSMKFDAEQGRGIGNIYEIADLRDAAFIRFDRGSAGQIEFARNPISAVLLCAFGYLPMKAVGALHPNPNLEFDRALLPNIEFARLAEGFNQTNQLDVEWI